MKVFDVHMHIGEGPVNKNDFAGKLKTAGVDGGAILSQPPSSFIHGGKLSTAERLDNLFLWADSGPALYPFFWVDPTEEDAGEQVKTACGRGVSGFKIICNHFYPGDDRAMKIYKLIAKAGKPVLFHSGICWGGQVSSKYNRPSEFEALIEVDGLKFALAHLSWPWSEECIAVYGKFLDAYSNRPDLSVEMFLDITPGDFSEARRDILERLFTIGYEVSNNILYGTDRSVNNYDFECAKRWIKRDNEVFTRLKLGNEVLEGIYSGNLMRFLGILPGQSGH